MRRTCLLSLGALASMAFQTAAFAQPQNESTPLAGPGSGLLLMAPLVEATEPAPPEEAAGEPGQMFRLAPLPDPPTGPVRLLRFTAPNAAAYRFYFESVALPEGARMFLYGLDTGGRVTTVFGPYEQSGPLAEGYFRSRVVPGIEAVIEIQGMEDGRWPMRVPRVAAIDAALLADLRAFDSESLTETPEQRKPPSSDRIEIEIHGKLVAAEIIDGDVVVEGDIVLGAVSELAAATGSSSKDNRRLAVMRTEASGRWPGGVVPFVIDSALAGDTRIINPNPNGPPGALQILMALMNGVLSFVPRSSEPDFIRFSSSTKNECRSGIGRTSGARIITLGSSCSTGNAIHEIGHALGLYHEQSREDRDKFVRIVSGNICCNAGNNFQKATGEANTDIGFYDFGSIMHYPLDAFTKNGQNTIEPLVPVPAGIIVGQRTAPSNGDVNALKSRYGVTVSPGVVNVPSAGGIFSVRVSTQNDRFWTAQGDATWVSVLSGGSGQGNGIVQFSVGSNELVLTQGASFLVTPGIGFQPPPRTANLHIGLAPFARTAAVKIIQASPDCTYSVKPSKILAESDAGTFTVTVTTAPHCTWGAAEALPWVQLSPTSSQGTRTVSVKLTANVNDNKLGISQERTGTITVAGKTVVIEQKGGCLLCGE